MGVLISVSSQPCAAVSLEAHHDLPYSLQLSGRRSIILTWGQQHFKEVLNGVCEPWKPNLRLSSAALSQCSPASPMDTHQDRTVYDM